MTMVSTADQHWLSGRLPQTLGLVDFHFKHVGRQTPIKRLRKAQGLASVSFHRNVVHMARQSPENNRDMSYDKDTGKTLGFLTLSAAVICRDWWHKCSNDAFPQFMSLLSDCVAPSLENLRGFFPHLSLSKPDLFPAYIMWQKWQYVSFEPSTRGICNSPLCILGTLIPHVNIPG